MVEIAVGVCMCAHTDGDVKGGMLGNNVENFEKPLVRKTLFSAVELINGRTVAERLLDILSSIRDHKVTHFSACRPPLPAILLVHIGRKPGKYLPANNIASCALILSL
jgi:hypothetical protein